jgi:hypothetical protein
MYKEFLIGLACGYATGLQAADPYEIMSHSIKLAEANWSEAPNYSYTRTDSDREGGSHSAGKTYQVLVIEGSPFLKIVAEGGHELSPSAAREEDQKLQREVAKRRSESPRERRKRMQKYAEERNRDHAFLTEIAVAFEFSIADEQQSRNGAFWLVEGKPKPGYDPPTREGKVLADMTVKFWIDKATCQWQRLEAQVEKPVSIYGLIAKVNPGTKFTLEQEPVSANVWLPRRFTMQVNATALGFIKKDSVQDQTYSNYRLVQPSANSMNRSPASEAGLQ